MRAAWHFGFVMLTFGLVGCAADGSDQDLFSGFRSPFRTERGFDPAKAPTASTKAATRVHTVGNDVVAKNRSEIAKKPVFLTVGLQEPMIFHRSGGDIVISEGLVDRCGTDAELAAAICFELGKMSSETEGRGRNIADVPPAPRLAPDVVGSGQTADMTRMAEEGFNDRRAPRGAGRARELKNDPKTLSQTYLVNAGFSADDLTKLESLLKEAEDNSEKRDILKGR